MISDSAWVTRLQLCPALSRAWEASTYPWARSFVSCTEGAVPVLYVVSQLAPWVRTSLRLNCGWGRCGDQGLSGWYSVATAYWSRSMYPVSVRTMNGTVAPVSVVVVAINAEGGGLAGS